MPQLMRTSNPALNDQVFRGEGAAFGEAHDGARHRQQNRDSSALRHCHGGLDLESLSAFALGASRGAAGAGWGDRRVDFRVCHDFQEDLGAGDRSDLRVARRTGAGQRLRDAGTALSGHRHSGGEPDFRHDGRAAAGVSLGPDSSDGQVPAGHRRGDGRNCAFLRDAR